MHNEGISLPVPGYSIESQPPPLHEYARTNPRVHKAWQWSQQPQGQVMTSEFIIYNFKVDFHESCLVCFLWFIQTFGSKPILVFSRFYYIIWSPIMWYERG